MKIAAQRVEEFCRHILMRLNMSREDASLVAAHLADADLRGVRSHGLIRMSRYVDQIDSGYIAHRASVTQEHIAPNMLRVDAHHQFGIIAFHKLLPQLIELTRQHGLAGGAITNCAHTGRMGAYSEFLAQNFMWSCVFGGGGHRKLQEVAPYGGRRPVFDTNPYSVSMPLDGERIATSDFATSATAQGKLFVYRTNDEPVPPGWILDKNGEPTTDVNDFYDGGTMLPAGGVKGYGIGFMAELFGDAVLGEPHELNWFIVATDLNRFVRSADYFDAAKVLRTKIETCPPIVGVDKVMWPGQPEMERKLHQGAEGIEYSDDEVASIGALENRFAVRLAD